MAVRSENFISALKRIPVSERDKVNEVTLDMPNSMNKIVQISFPKAIKTINRFHIQELACDAIQEMRIKYRGEAIQEETEGIQQAKYRGKVYKPVVYSNGDTKKQLLAHARYLLFKSPNKWAGKKRERTIILFAQYPDLKKAYSLKHSLRMIFSKNSVKDAAGLSLAR